MSTHLDSLTDEQRSAIKDEAQGLRSEDLQLSDADLKWWRDAKFGMFIHWGLYAITGKGEWHMHNEKIPAVEYAKLADQFHPTKFNARDWARLAKEAGMKYGVLTARHHDGFSLWDSPGSWGNFTSAATAARRDFIRDYADAFRAEGLGVGIYYSPMDWRFPAYFHPREMPENAEAMKQQCYDQIRELMSNYGKIDVLWYDGGWLAHQGTNKDAAWLWEPLKLNKMVRDLQPTVVISPRSGWEGDFVCEEGEKPITGPIREQLWEKAMRINTRGWGYTEEEDLLPVEDLLEHLVNAICRNGNLLLNVGPDTDGVIPETQAARLRTMGQWLRHCGEAVFGTRPGPFQPVEGLYGSTCRPGTVYVHVLHWPDGVLHLPPLKFRIIGGRILNGGKCTVRQTPEGIEISAGKEARPVRLAVVALAVEDL
jgi:alpha-L-fucosidase